MDIIIFIWWSIHCLSIRSPGPLQNFLKLSIEVSSRVLSSCLLRYPSRSKSNKSKTKRIFSFVEDKQIIERPQQNSLKSIQPERSRSNSLNADSATYYIFLFELSIITFGKVFKSVKTFMNAYLSRPCVPNGPELPPPHLVSLPLLMNSWNLFLRISICFSFH